MIITGPGFYTSKAGKCEVVALKNDLAIGWTEGGFPQTWYLSNGAVFDLNAARTDLHDIIGKWTEPRKPVEAWAVLWRDGDLILYDVKSDAENDMEVGARLVHLREFEDSNDNG